MAWTVHQTLPPLTAGNVVIYDELSYPKHYDFDFPNTIREVFPGNFGGNIFVLEITPEQNMEFQFPGWWEEYRKARKHLLP